MTQGFDIQKIFDQFEKKNVDLRCRMCGHETFSVLIPDETDFQTYLPWRSLSNDSRLNNKSGLTTISISCARCGYIEQFLADALLEEKV